MMLISLSRRILTLGAWIILIFGTSSTAFAFFLALDLRTDYLPGTEFIAVRTTLTPGPTQIIPAFTTDDFITGSRIAEFDGLSNGDYSVLVELLRPDESILDSRTVLFDNLDGNHADILLITRPEPPAPTCDEQLADTQEQLTETQGALLACSIFLGFCQTDLEEVQSDLNECQDNLACLSTDCTAGLGECRASGRIVCKADGSGPECNAVPGRPSREICDGLDNDCDGLVDNNTSLCDDGNACNGQETCGPGAEGVTCLPGTPPDCNDGDACTDDSCKDNQCQHIPDLGNEGCVLPPACPDGICDASAGETCGNCIADCGSCPPTDPTSPTDGLTEVCDGVDNDQDGTVDEGCAGATTETTACSSGGCGGGDCVGIGGSGANQIVTPHRDAGQFVLSHSAILLALSFLLMRRIKKFSKN